MNREKLTSLTLLVVLVGILIVLGSTLYFSYQSPLNPHNLTTQGTTAQLPAQETMNVDLALKKIYGNYDPRNHTATWIVSQNDSANTTFSYGQDGDSFSVKPLAYYQQSNRYYLLTQASSPQYTAHIAAAIIGAYIFEYRNNMWNVIYSNKGIDGIGSFGVFDGATSIIKISDTVLAFRLDGGYGMSGYQRSIK